LPFLSLLNTVQQLPNLPHREGVPFRLQLRDERAVIGDLCAVPPLPQLDGTLFSRGQRLLGASSLALLRYELARRVVAGWLRLLTVAIPVRGRPGSDRLLRSVECVGNFVEGHRIDACPVETAGG